jgi:hypothetical protein
MRLRSLPKEDVENREMAIWCEEHMTGKIPRRRLIIIDFLLLILWEHRKFFTVIISDLQDDQYKILGSHGGEDIDKLIVL